MQFAHLRSISLSFTAYGSRRSLSKARFALQLLLVAMLLLPVAASAQADNTITTADTVGVKIYFRQGYSSLQPAFRENGIRLDEFMRRVSEMHGDSTARLNSIDIVAYASPEGSFTLNRKLARKRAENISAYLRGNMPFLSGSLFNVQPKGIDWNGLAAGAYVICDFVRIAQPAIPINKPNEPNEANGANEANEVDAAIPVATELPERDYDRWAIKSNALYLAAGVTNIGGEYAFHPHWSVDLPLVYSPYTLARTYRMRFLYIQPEARYWLDRPMKGHFFGVHLHAGVFNVSLDNRNRYQSEKGFHGAGISYGYAMPLSRRWSMEFTVGVGYAFTKYCTYYNVPNGIRYEKDLPYHYWGLTKLGINFVYRFGDKCGKTKSRKEAGL